MPQLVNEISAQPSDKLNQNKDLITGAEQVGKDISTGVVHGKRNEYLSRNNNEMRLIARFRYGAGTWIMEAWRELNQCWMRWARETMRHLTDCLGMVFYRWRCMCYDLGYKGVGNDW